MDRQVNILAIQIPVIQRVQHEYVCNTPQKRDSLYKRRLERIFFDVHNVEIYRAGSTMINKIIEQNAQPEKYLLASKSAIKQKSVTKSIPIHWIGMDAARNGDWNAAYRLAVSALKIDPEHLTALEVLCQSQLHLGQPNEALKTLRKLIRINPKEAGYETLRASAMQELGRLQEALISLHRAHALARNEQHKARILQEIDILIACLGFSDESLKQIGLEPFPTSESIRKMSREAIPMVH